MDKSSTQNSSSKNKISSTSAQDVFNSIRNYFLKIKLSKPRHVLTGLILFIFFFWFSLALVATYSSAKIPFVSEKTRADLIIGLYNVPFLPRTPEQILLVAVEKSTAIKSYTPDFSFSAKIGTESITGASMDFHIRGPIDLSQKEKTSMDLTADALLTFGGKSYPLSAKIIKAEDKVYYRLDKLPDPLFSLGTMYVGYGSGQSIPRKTSDKSNKALGKWTVYNSGGLKTEANKNLDKESDGSFINDIRKSTQDFFLKSEILKEVKRLNDEDIDGVRTYHLQLVPSRALIKKIYEEYALTNKSAGTTYPVNPYQAMPDISSAVEDVTIDVYLGKGDLILRKLSVVSKVRLDYLSSLSGSPSSAGLLGVFGADSLVNPRLSVSAVVLASDINKPVHISAPSPVFNLEK